MFNANIPSQCVDASKFIADRLEQLGIPHKILTRHIPHDASKVAEIGDATDSHTMLEVVFSNKVWVIDTQLKQFTLADRNKLKLPEEFVSRHIYQADDYYAAVPVFSDSICAERVVSATLSSDQTSSSPMNETFYNKIPIIIPEVGSLVSEGTGFNSLGTWYTEGPSERFPYGVVTKKLPTAQDARREFANLLEVSLDNPQFVQPVSLDDNSYSMEYLPGFSLQDVLDKKASLPKEISISGDLSSFARKMSRSSPERYIELQSEGKTRRFTLHEAINAAIEHSHGSMDREGVRMLTQQILQMSQGKHTENIVFPQDIEPKNIRFTPRGIVMIDAGRVILHATPIEFIMTYWVPRIMQYIVTASSPVSYSVQQTRDDNENYLAVGQGEFDIVRARDSLSVVTSIGADPCVLVVIDDRDNGISLLAHMDSNNAVADESYSAFFDALVREGTSPAGVNIHLFGADNAPSRKTGQTIKRGIEKELRKRVASFDVQGKIKEDFAGAQSRSVGIDAKEGTPFTLTKPLAHTKAAFIRGMNRRSVYGNPVQYLKTYSFAIASSPITMEQIRNKVADDSQRILVDVLTTPDEKGGRQPRTVWFDYDKRLLITVFGIDNEQFRRQLQVSVLNKTISDSERLKDVVNRIMGQPESVFGALNRYIIEVNNLDRLREESGIATRRQTRINMLNDLRDALAPLVMVSKINGYISTGKVNTRGQIEIKFTPHDLTSVRQALELLPDLDAGIWETASILLIQIEPMEGSSSPIIKDTKGGIDFRSFPVTTQPALNAQLSSMPIPRPLVSINLDESWGQIQNMLKAGIIPSNERIKEYLQTCCEKKNMEQEVDKILACIADILRLQEERVVSTDSSLKEMLALLESNKPANEMQFVLAKIIVPDKEPLAIAQ